MTDIDAAAARFQTSLEVEPDSWLDRVRRERQAHREQEMAELAQLDTPEARLDEWLEEERAISAALRRRSGRSRTAPRPMRPKTAPSPSPIGATGSPLLTVAEAAKVLRMRRDAARRLLLRLELVIEVDGRERVHRDALDSALRTLAPSRRSPKTTTTSERPRSARTATGTYLLADID